MSLKVIVGLEDYSPWSGAIGTWERVQESNKVEALDSILEELYPDGIEEIVLNDILWFESEWVLDSLGISDEEEDEDD